ncbi:MAG: DUF648 domain-containing protein [Parachlamydiaceae bacterium]
MDKLNFSTAVQFEEQTKTLHRTLMEKVDNYFYFGGRKVAVEKSKDGRDVAVGYVDQPVSTLHKVLKALFYVIFPVPLAMLGMKFVLRKVYKIDTENMNQNAHFQKDDQGGFRRIQTVVDEALGFEEGERFDYDEFKGRALAIKALEPNDELQLDLSEEDEELLVQANNHLRMEGIQIVHGGSNRVFFLDSQPDVVFKPMGSIDKAEKYVEDVETARRIVNEEQLDLIFIPRAKIINIRGENFIAQERASLVSGDYYHQKGIYHRFWADPEMREYIQKLFTQLITFIVKTGFSDVKYDNIPLDMNGRVALIDLDTTSTIIGLTQARAGRRQGILHYASLDNFEDFCNQARELLGEEANRLEISIEQIHSKLEERTEKDERYMQFCEEQQIHSARQPLNENLPRLFKDKKKQRFAEDLVKCINQKLAKQDNLSLRIGRRVTIDTDDRMYRSAADYGIITESQSLQDNLKEICSELQAAGYIFRFKIISYPNSIRITC